MDQHAELFSDLASEEMDSGRAPGLPSLPEPTPEEPEKETPPPPRPRPAQRQR
jgi:hypothetical protein